MASALAYARSQLGGACKSGDTDRIGAARTHYNRAVIDDRIATIAELIDALTDEQRARLARLAA